MSNNRYKILVVEDDDNIRSLIGTILETNGYQMIPTNTCKMGITLYASQRTLLHGLHQRKILHCWLMH